MELRCERCQEILPAQSEAGSACPNCGQIQGGEGSLDDELGAAFESMLHTEEGSAPSEEADPKSIEWYVAIEGQQVGPVSFADLQERWARGVIGPDSLCWRAGLPDWVQIASLPELIGALPPSPPIPSRSERREEEAAAQPRVEKPAATAAEGNREPEWRPSAASALESLVSKEVEEAEKRKEEDAADPAIPDPETTGIRVVLRDLPAPPPPEPSKFIPIPKNVPAPAPAPAARTKRPAPAAPVEEKGGRLGLYALVGLVLLLGGGAFAYFGGFLPGVEAPPAEPLLMAEASPSAPEDPAPEGSKEPVEEPAEESLARAANEEEESDEEASEEEIAEEAVDEEEEPEPPAVAKAASSAPKASAPPKRSQPPSRQEARAARPSRPSATPSRPPAPPAERPAQPPVPRPASGVLAAGNSSSIDSLFEQEGSSPRPVEARRGSEPYVPPPPGSGVQRPRQLGQGEIMGVVRNHRSELRNCATKYKEQGGSSGSVVMSWAIEPDGRTSGVKVAKGQEHAGMARCLEELIKGWRFPSYSGPKMEPIEFPFQF